MVLPRLVILLSIFLLHPMKNVAGFSATTTSTAIKQTKWKVLASSIREDLSLLALNNDNFDSLRPETSFGADAVPEGQRPVNEYLDLIRAPLFGWASEETGTAGLCVRLALVYLVSFATVCYPIAGATFTQDGYLLQKLAAANFGAVSLLGILMIRLYSGWGYVGSRLQSKRIEYEETGWYDGDFEVKDEAERQRDMFLYSSDVKPVENRLKLVGSILFAIWIVSLVGLNASYNAKPLFDEYDVKMLERLPYDDKLADVASQQAGGRPTYCDSRYYRAVANGGQGCD